ncbi:MAG: hypothetical protein ACXVXI_02875 [Mycobacteriaceae bacterium]
MLTKIKPFKKTAAAVAGFVAEAVASGLLSGTALHWAQAVLAVATVVGVYQAKNEPKPAILGKA